MNGTARFPATYQAARDRFLEVAQGAGARIESATNPLAGPAGEPLCMDVACFGPADAGTILVVSSGTHGVEGLAGSGIQNRLLDDGLASRLPPRVGLLLVHAINPWGMAYRRRVTEDNVDLNRNFLDHAEPHPANPGYEKLAGDLAPRSLAFHSELAAWSRMWWYRLSAGARASQLAVSGGQYSHPTGLFFGGTSATWSNGTVRALVGRCLGHAARIVAIDLHTGLGAFGEAEIILSDPPTSSAYRRAVAIWGPARVRSTVTGGSVSVHIEASLKRAFTDTLPRTDITAMTLEFGTAPPMEIFRALRVENWLYHHGGDAHPRAREIKTRLLRTFHPDSVAWETRVWTQAREIVEQAIAWLRPGAVSG